MPTLSQKKRMEIQTAHELSRETARSELEYRISWCANLYGNHWREEEAFLKACLHVFTELERRDEQDRWRVYPKEKPKEDAVVLCTVYNGHPAAEVKKEVRCALYEDEDFTIDGEDEGEFVPLAWRPAPAPWAIEVSKNDAD